MKRRTLILLILVIGVGLITAIVWWFPKKRTPYPEKLFQVADTGEVAEILLVDKQGRRVHLVREENFRWRLNDTLWAEPAAVRSLLRALARQKVVQPASPRAITNVLREMDVSGIRVVVRDRSGNLLQDFIVGMATPDNLATYMLRTGDTLPYVVMLPGHIGVLTPRYTPDVRQWRLRTLLRLTPQQIQEIQVVYFTISSEEERSFRIRLTESTAPVPSCQIVPLDEGSALPSDSLNPGACLSFLQAFERVGVMAFVPDSLAQEIIQDTPYAELRIRLHDGTVRVLTCWFHPLDERSRISFDPQTRYMLRYDLERFYCYAKWTEEMYLMHWSVLGKLLRSYEEFFVPLFPGIRTPPRVLVSPENSPDR